MPYNEWKDNDTLEQMVTTLTMAVQTSFWVILTN